MRASSRRKLLATTTKASAPGSQDIPVSLDFLAEAASAASECRQSYASRRLAASRPRGLPSSGSAIGGHGSRVHHRNTYRRAAQQCRATRQTASEAVTAGAQRTASDWRIAKTLVRSSREGPDRQGLERHGPCPRAPVRGRIFSQILLRLYSAILAQASPGLIEPGRTAASMMVSMPHLASSGLSPAWL